MLFTYHPSNQGASVVQRQCAWLLVNRSSDLSCTKGMIYNKLNSLAHVISDLLQPYNCRILALNTIIIIIQAITYHPRNSLRTLLQTVISFSSRSNVCNPKARENIQGRELCTSVSINHKNNLFPLQNLPRLPRNSSYKAKQKINNSTNFSHFF